MLRIFSFIVIIAICVFIKPLNAQIFTAPSEGKAVVYITRTSSLGAIINFRFYNNDQYIGRFNAKKHIRYECNPGEQLFWVSSENRSFVQANLEEGGIYVLEAQPKLGALKARVVLMPVDFRTAKPALVQKIEQLVSNKPPLVFSPQDLAEMNQRFESYIQEGMSVYQRRLEKNKNIGILSTDMSIKQG